MHTLRIYTAQMGKRFQLAKEGRAILDTTVKTGDRRLAPSWDFLVEYKSSPRSPADQARYRELYLNKLKAMHHQTPDVLLDLLKRDEVILTCYCPAGQFCHRHILKEILTLLGSRTGVNVEDCGEII